MNNSPKEMVAEFFQEYLNKLDSLQNQIDGGFPRGLDSLKDEMARFKDDLKDNARSYSSKDFQRTASKLMTAILVPGLQRAKVNFDCRVGSHPSKWADAICRTRVELKWYKDQLNNCTD